MVQTAQRLRKFTARPGTYAAGWNDGCFHVPCGERNGVSAGEYAVGFRDALRLEAAPSDAFNQEKR
jgi:hypothetical protein